MSVPKKKMQVVENKLTPPELRRRIQALSGTIGQQYRELANHLDEVLTRRLFADWGFESFNRYLTDEVKISVRGGYYSIQVARRLREAGVTDAEAKDVPWTGLKEVANVIDPANKAKWLAAAKQTPTRELAQQVRRETGGEVRHAVHFSLAEDQYENWERALKKARKATGSDKVPWLVDCICMAFNSEGFDERGEALSHWLKEIERVYGVEVQIVQPVTAVPKAKKGARRVGT